MEDWKGEHLIRNATKKADRKAETQRVISNIYHRVRRAKGEPAPAARQHSAFMRVTLAEMKKGE